MEAVDEDTIAIEVGDTTIYIDVTVYGDNNTIVIEVNEDDSCDSDTPAGSDTSIAGEVSTETYEEIVLIDRLTATWCYDSGYPYMLSVIIVDEDEVWVAFPSANEDYLDGSTTDLDFVTTNFTYLSNSQEASISTRNTDVEVDELVDYADVTMDDEDDETMMIDFGVDLEATFVKSASSTEGDCPDISVDEDDLEGLID